MIPGRSLVDVWDILIRRSVIASFIHPCEDALDSKTRDQWCREFPCSFNFPLKTKKQDGGNQTAIIFTSLAGGAATVFLIDLG